MGTPEDVQEKVLGLTAPELEILGFDLVDFEALAGGNQVTLRFSIERLVEGDDPEAARVTIDEVARASRAIAKAIEAEEAAVGEFLGRYTIEVSSPGIFRKLKRPEHYRRHVGQIVKVVATDAEGHALQVRGRLAAADGTKARIEPEDGEAVEVELSRVRRAKLDPDLDFGKRRESR